MAVGRHVEHPMEHVCVGGLIPDLCGAGQAFRREVTLQQSLQDGQEKSRVL